jgi:hypothetical protein
MAVCTTRSEVQNLEGSEGRDLIVKRFVEACIRSLLAFPWKQVDSNIGGNPNIS